MLDAILELLTGPEISSERMRESAMTLVYFEPKILAEIDRIGRSYDEQKRVRFVLRCCSESR